jgi:hypothetical protein
MCAAHEFYSLDTVMLLKWFALDILITFQVVLKINIKLC